MTERDSVQPKEFADVRLWKRGEEITASITVPGAIVEATGDSVKDALQMLADAMDENDEPFWEIPEANDKAYEY